MGGKNAIIVDDDADLDEAVLGVVQQRVRLPGTEVLGLLAGDRARRRLRQFRRAAGRSDAQPARSARPKIRRPSVGPVIDAEALERIQRVHRDRPRRRPRGAGDRRRRAGRARAIYVGPHIFADVPPDGAAGPGRNLRPGAGRDRAPATSTRRFAIANGTDYALTGGIFSRSPAHLERARRELLVGNLYLNRGITGALVGRQPFGGFKHVGHRQQGRRPRLPAAIRRPAHGHRKHHAPRLRAAGRGRE